MPMRIPDTLAPIERWPARAPTPVARPLPAAPVTEHETSRRREVVVAPRPRPPAATGTALQGELLGRATGMASAVHLYLALARLDDPFAPPRPPVVDLYA
jgi:hypothetical protein